MAIQQNVVRQLQSVVRLPGSVIVERIVAGTVLVVPVMITNHAQPSQFIASEAQTGLPAVPSAVVVAQAVTTQSSMSSHLNTKRAFTFTERPGSTEPQLTV